MTESNNNKTTTTTIDKDKVKEQHIYSIPSLFNKK